MTTAAWSGVGGEAGGHRPIRGCCGESEVANFQPRHSASRRL